MTTATIEAPAVAKPAKKTTQPMKIIVDRAAFVVFLRTLAQVAPRRSPKKILECVYLRAHKGRLTGEVYNQDERLTLDFPRCEVASDGDVAVPVGKLLSLVSVLDSPTVTIQADERSTVVTNPSVTAKIYGHDAKEWPAADKVEFINEASIEASDFKLTAEQTIFAAARENSRYAINGLFMEFKADKLTMVATDGHRLAISKCATRGRKFDGHFIMPTAAVRRCIGLAKASLSPLVIAVTDTLPIRVTGDGFTYITKRIEGNFPPYNDVIPKDCTIKAKLNRSDMLRALTVAEVATNEESRGAIMSLSETGIIIKSRAPEYAELVYNIETLGHEGEPIEIGFNPAYLIQALKVCGSDEISLSLNAKNKPGVLRSGTGFTYVVMPVNY